MKIFIFNKMFKFFLMQFKGVNALVFPAKRTFNNMDKLFLERRQFLLNEYLENLLKPEFISGNPGLQECIFDFFDRGTYEQSKGAISRKVISISKTMNLLSSSMNTLSSKFTGGQSCKSISKLGSKCFYGG